MVALLAFVAVIIILWYLSKTLKRASVWLTTMSFEVADYASAMKRKQVEENKALRQQNIKVAERVHSIKGAPSDVEYSSNVRSQIDLLEKEINGVE